MSEREQAQLFRMCSITTVIYSIALPYCESITHIQRQWSKYSSDRCSADWQLTPEAELYRFFTKHVLQPGSMWPGCLVLPALLRREQHLIPFLRDSQGVNCIQVEKVQISEKQWTQTLLKITAFCCLRERRIRKPKGIFLSFYGWFYPGEICQRNAIFKADIIKTFESSRGEIADLSHGVQKSCL